MCDEFELMCVVCVKYYIKMEKCLDQNIICEMNDFINMELIVWYFIIYKDVMF